MIIDSTVGNGFSFRTPISLSMPAGRGARMCVRIKIRQPGLAGPIRFVETARQRVGLELTDELGHRHLRRRRGANDANDAEHAGGEECST